MINVSGLLSKFHQMRLDAMDKKLHSFFSFIRRALGFTQTHRTRAFDDLSSVHIELSRRQQKLVSKYVENQSSVAILEAAQCLKTDVSILKNRALYLLLLSTLAIFLLSLTKFGMLVIPVVAILVTIFLSFVDRIAILQRIDSTEDLIECLLAEVEKRKL
ncbi:hypothetical protein ACOZZ1_002036 [Vibrio fluvialis]